jgi:hypothetical protein
MTIIDYCHSPPGGRLLYERDEGGFTITIPPIGMWRRARWSLLLVLIFLAPLITMIVITLTVLKTPLLSIWQILPLIWRNPPPIRLLLPMLALPLTIVLSLILSLIGAYLEGHRSTVIDVRKGEVTITIRGRLRKKTWRFTRADLRRPKFHWTGVVQLASRSSFRFKNLRYARRDELRWVWRLLNDAYDAEQSRSADNPASHREAAGLNDAKAEILNDSSPKLFFEGTHRFRKWESFIGGVAICAVSAVLFLLARRIVNFPGRLGLVLNIVSGAVFGLFFLIGAYVLYLWSVDRQLVLRITAEGVEYSRTRWPWTSISRIGGTYLDGGVAFVVHPRGRSLARMLPTTPTPTREQFMSVMGSLQVYLSARHAHVTVDLAPTGRD